MATKGRSGAGLCLLQDYNSDSDVDSGYTSDQEKKRKQEESENEIRNKKHKPNSTEEEMIVDPILPENEIELGLEQNMGKELNQHFSNYKMLSEQLISSLRPSTSSIFGASSHTYENPSQKAGINLTSNFG